MSSSVLFFLCKVDMRKVNLQVMRPWIANKVTELVGFEDEVVVEYAMGLLEDPSQPVRRHENFCEASCSVAYPNHYFRPRILVRCRSI